MESSTTSNPRSAFPPVADASMRLPSLSIAAGHGSGDIRSTLAQSFGLAPSHLAGNDKGAADQLLPHLAGAMPPEIQKMIATGQSEKINFLNDAKNLGKEPDFFLRPDPKDPSKFSLVENPNRGPSDGKLDIQFQGKEKYIEELKKINNVLELAALEEEILYWQMFHPGEDPPRHLLNRQASIQASMSDSPSSAGGGEGGGQQGASSASDSGASSGNSGGRSAGADSGRSAGSGRSSGGSSSGDNYGYSGGSSSGSNSGRSSGGDSGGYSGRSSGGDSGGYSGGSGGGAGGGYSGGSGGGDGGGYSGGSGGGGGYSGGGGGDGGGYSGSGGGGGGDGGGYSGGSGGDGGGYSGGSGGDGGGRSGGGGGDGAAHTGGGADVQINESSPRAMQIMDYFVEKGLTPQQAAGIVGNMERESGLNPGIQEHGSGIGYGLVQWSFGRRTELEGYAAGIGKPAEDMMTQLDFMWKEMNGSENATLKAFQDDPNMSPAAAAESFCQKYERPGVIAMDERISAAEQFYDQYKQGGDQGASKVTVAEPIPGKAPPPTELNGRLADEVRNVDASMDGTGRCAAAVQVALQQAGLPEYVGSGNGWEMANNLAKSGKFEQVSAAEAQPGDIIGREWSESEKAKNGGADYGDISVVTERAGNTITQSNDATYQYLPDNPMYQSDVFLRYTGGDKAAPPGADSPAPPGTGSAAPAVTDSTAPASTASAAPAVTDSPAPAASTASAAPAAGSDSTATASTGSAAAKTA